MTMRQRVLINADANTGKTGMLVQIALNNPDQPCFIFDTQDKVARVASIFGGIPKNLTVGFTPDAASMLDFMNKKVRPVLKGQPSGYGIVMIDMAGEIWNELQEYMADILATVAGGDKSQGLGDPLADQRAALILAGKDAASGGFDGFKGQWQTIRGWYNSVVKDLMFKMRPHVFVTTAGRAIRPTESKPGKANPKADKEDLQTVWANFGFAPEGEKNLTFWADTCLGISVEGTKLLKKHKLSVLKDVTPDGVPFMQTLDLDAGKHTPTDRPIIDYWKTYCDSVGYAPYLLPNPVTAAQNEED